MSEEERKAILHRYLREAREAVVWKLDGLSEYDVRWPVVPTGTNLLGLVKHLAGLEAEYFGAVFGRPFPEPLPWLAEDAEPNADMWATPEESRDDILALYRRACAHADETIAALPLDGTGEVPWWREGRRGVTLYRVLVHMTAESQHHAGHADIARELIDGAAGLRRDNDNLVSGDAAWWGRYRARLEEAARQAGTSG